MFNRLSLTLIFLLIIGAFPWGEARKIQQSTFTKVQFHQLVTKELQKRDCKFVLIQKANHKQNIFAGQQNGMDWILQHKSKPFRIEKRGNNVFTSINKNKETLSTDQFGIISPLEHLELVRASGDTIYRLPITTLNKKEVNHVTVTINEQKLAHILKNRFKMSHAPDLSTYLSGKVQVTYDLYYSLETRELLKFSTKIRSSGDPKERCNLIYLF